MTAQLIMETAVPESLQGFWDRYVTPVFEENQALKREIQAVRLEAQDARDALLIAKGER